MAVVESASGVADIDVRAPDATIGLLVKPVGSPSGTGTIQYQPIGGASDTWETIDIDALDMSVQNTRIVEATYIKALRVESSESSDSFTIQIIG